jgi:predicted MPP superfamily phosphohydrolase
MASSSSRIAGFHAPTVRAVRAPLRALAMPIRVVQLTDLHFGLVTPRRLIARAVEHARGLEPDLVVLTGDFVCRGNRWVSQIEPTLRPLAAAGIPVVAVLGNHDHFVAADAVRRALERAGATVLQNRWTRLAVAAGPLWVAGLDDSTTGHDDLAATVAGLPDPLRHPVLGLTHNPAAAPDLWSRGVHAVLSGHTHAGQFVVPGVTERFYRRLLGQPYVGGLHTASPPDTPDDAWVYVSAGVGAGAVPWRVGTPAAREVTHLTLHPG